jgi:hypothetical protein
MMDIVSTKLMGGLGNYMFQIAAAYAISLRDNKSLICETYDMQVPQKPAQAYQNNLFRKISFAEERIIHTPFGEPKFSYTEIPQIDGNIRLYGYFQSEKYFEHYKREVAELFELNSEIQDKVLSQYQEILEKNTTSINVRRGDYVWLSDYHANQELDYYKKAIEIIGEEEKFLIFSDDISWCKENLDFIKNKTFVTNDFDYEDLFLMSQCSNNIIANSSFSWWGAWLNKNDDKVIVAPKNWFGKSNSHLDTSDLYCEKWHII